MTREEAIEILEANRPDPCYQMLREAVDFAVDALKAQGTCEDAVSRQTLQKELALYPIDDVTSEDEAGYNRAINDVQKMVLHLPSAQPEIIRCRDCKYWREHKYAKETKRYIPFCGFNAIYTKADDFCSRAERRIDE